MSGLSAADKMVAALTPHLGPHTARNAVKTFAKRTLDKTPESLTAEDALKVLENLQPTLAALSGASAAKEIIRSLTEELMK